MQCDLRIKIYIAESTSLEEAIPVMLKASEEAEAIRISCKWARETKNLEKIILVLD